MGKRARLLLFLLLGLVEIESQLGLVALRCAVRHGSITVVL